VFFSGAGGVFAVFFFFFFFFFLGKPPAVASQTAAVGPGIPRSLFLGGGALWPSPYFSCLRS